MILDSGLLFWATLYSSLTFPHSPTTNNDWAHSPSYDCIFFNVHL